MLSFNQETKIEYLFRLFNKDWDRSLGLIDFRLAFDKLIENAKDEAEKDRLSRAVNSWYTSIWFFADLVMGDKNREIDKQEWMEWAEYLNDDLKNGDIESRQFVMWRDAVYDTIGAGDSISVTEYAAWWDSFGIEGDAAANFAKLDSNGDGAITKEEVTTLLVAFVTGNDLSSFY